MKTSSLILRFLSPILASLMPCGLAFSQSSGDSLTLALLETDVRKAELEVQQTGLAHRLIPQVRLSASYGVRDVVFFDPSTDSPFLIPRDSYRLTLSLSVTDLFDGSKHDLALCQLERARTEYLRGREKLRDGRTVREKKLGLLREERRLMEEEAAMLDKIAEYDQMLFERGKLAFAELSRSRLQVIAAKERAERLLLEISELTLNEANP